MLGLGGVSAAGGISWIHWIRFKDPGYLHPAGAVDFITTASVKTALTEATSKTALLAQRAKTLYSDFKGLGPLRFLTVFKTTLSDTFVRFGRF